MEYTGERYVPEVRDPQTSYEHWHRYLFASQYVHNKVVLDIASGEGFGSHLLAQTAKTVTGVDISADAVAHASSKYTLRNLQFFVGSVDRIPVATSESFDVVVSFETIEHVGRDEQTQFLMEVRRLLKPDGLLICSTPNKLLYSDLPKYKNEFHVDEFTVHDFREFLTGYFHHVRLLGQRVYPVSYIWPEEQGGKGLSEFRLALTEAGFRPTADAKELIYAIALCSARPIEAADHSLVIDLSERLLRGRVEEIGSLRVALADKDEAYQALAAEERLLRTRVEEKDTELRRLEEQNERAARQWEERFGLLERQAAEHQRTAQALLEEKDVQLRHLEEQNERATRHWEERYDLLERQAAEQQRMAQALLEKRDALAGELEGLRAELHGITASTTWHLAKGFGRMRELVAPNDSGRHRAYLLLKRGVQVHRAEGFRVFLGRTREWFYRTRHKTPPQGVYGSHVQAIAAAIQAEVGEDLSADLRVMSRSSRGTEVAVYASSQGNYFFHEIADLLAAAFVDLGLRTERRTEEEGYSSRAAWHVVTAPHEFFELGGGRALRQNDRPANLILLNTEQPSTQWFALAAETFGWAYRIWDMNPLAAKAVAERGFSVEYLPLGYVPAFGSLGEVAELPETYGTCFLEPHIRSRSYLHLPLADRPIDVLFIGSLSPRREEFFTRAAETLSRHRCYLHFWDPVEPAIPGKNTHMDTATVVGLAQRSKLVLNVHRGTDSYFEWQRIVMHGIWQRALVVTEPCLEAPPFRAGHDFIEAQLEDIPEILDYYLLSPEGRSRGQSVADDAAETLKTQCYLPARLRDAVARLYVPIPGSQVAFWNPAVPVP